MPSRPLPTVHLVCGLNASGKTTLARDLAADLPAVCFSLDEWMLNLFDLRYDDPAYGDARDRCTEIIWRIAIQVLGLGCNVVLDWNQWSRDRRAHWHNKVSTAGYEVVLHFIDVPLAVALERSAKRNLERDVHSHYLSDADIRHLASLFERPSADEMVLVVHQGNRNEL
jgi:predicted kinase